MKEEVLTHCEHDDDDVFLTPSLSDKTHSYCISKPLGPKMKSYVQENQYCI